MGSLESRYFVPWTQRPLFCQVGKTSATARRGQMKIDAIKIENYKGFYDSGFVLLNPQWNVIVGQNNAGKTAFMEGFRLSGNPNSPHKDSRFPPDHLWPQHSKFSVRMNVQRPWLLKQWLKSGTQFYLPIQDTSGTPETYIKFWEGDDLDVELDFTSGGGASAQWPSHRLFNSKDSQLNVIFNPGPNFTIGPISAPQGNGNDSLPNTVLGARDSFIYLFDAKRFSPGHCAHGDSAKLEPDASNLPEVLHTLMGNPHLFEEYKSRVREIFPNIKSITVLPLGQNNLQIRLWPVEESERRVDLSISLDESGTGVGQVLAILYVAMNADPSLIGIDEPNSFLHPGAAKALIQILKRYDQHQYVISTHSPDIIGAAQPAALHLIRNDGVQSLVQTFEDTKVGDLRMMLEEVGASISDVFSVDRVVYVEGPTEKECFDLIVRRTRGGDEVGFAFVALRSTGDFEGRSDTESVLGIYDTLSQGGAIPPAKVAFSFDSEGKDARKIEDLKRRCEGRANVLPRRMTENYLLSPPAIAAALVDLGEADVTAELIEGLLREHGPKFMPKDTAFEYGSQTYYDQVHAAELLSEVFSAASNERHAYRKVRHGVQILMAIFQVDPDSIDGLIEYVMGLVETTK
jgi:hypothetical protein